MTFLSRSLALLCGLSRRLWAAIASRLVQPAPDDAEPCPVRLVRPAASAEADRLIAAIEADRLAGIPPVASVGAERMAQMGLMDRRLAWQIRVRRGGQ